MFIYIKYDLSSLDCGCLIERHEEALGYWYEISYKGVPSPRRCRRTIRLCDRGGILPIAGRNLPLKRREQARMLDEEPFDLLLAANAFSFVSRGIDSALFIDRRGLFHHCAAPALIAVRTLYIFTENRPLYSRWNEETLRRFGCSAVILPTLPRFSDFPAVLRLDGGETDSHPFLFGKGGYMPSGDEVTVRKKVLRRPLCAARYLCLKDDTLSSATPSLLCREDKETTLPALKNRLDRHLRYGL